MSEDSFKAFVKTDGIDLLHMTPGVPTYNNGHGTHIAGTLVSTQFGLVPKARLHAVKILDQKAVPAKAVPVLVPIRR